MITRAQVGIVKPNPCLHVLTYSLSPIPKSPSVALFDPYWRDAMVDEYNALIKNGTWIFVSKQPNVNVVRSMWLYKHKFCDDGSLIRYKARLVTNGRSQQFVVDYDDTFSPVVKPATIRIVLSLDLSRGWHVHQLDIKNPFLNGDLLETVYMYQPSGYALRFGFPLSQCGSSLFTYRALLQHIISSLHHEFDMTDLGAINYFLGISVTRDSRGMFLSQKKYALELLERAHMATCNSTRTLVNTESKLSSERDPVFDPTLYRSLAGGLQYLTFTRTDISYAVQQICLFMHDPREPHLAALKRILCYVKGTLEYGLQLYAFFSSSLVAYSDADWAGCPTTRRSTSGYCIFLGDNLLSCQRNVNTLFLDPVLRPNTRELQISADNTANSVQHQRTKHIEVDIHFVHDMVARGQVRVIRVPSRYQYADIFTKGLPFALFEEFRTNLSVRSPPTPTTKEC
ncbi:ribonuclease H-like domain-containing protein [Tanacetum coccineum]